MGYVGVLIDLYYCVSGEVQVVGTIFFFLFLDFGILLPHVLSPFT